MFKFETRIAVVFVLLSLSSINVRAENLSVQTYKSEEFKSGYVRIGLEAIRAFETAYSFFKEHQKNHDAYDSIFYTVQGNRIKIVFLMPPVELDGNGAFTVILDRVTLKVLSNP
jgi:hypothetical protein